MTKWAPMVRQDEVTRVKTALMRMGFPNVYDERTAADPYTVATGKPERLICGAHTYTWDEAKEIAGAMLGA